MIAMKSKSSVHLPDRHEDTVSARQQPLSPTSRPIFLMPPRLAATAYCAISWKQNLTVNSAFVEAEVESGAIKSGGQPSKSRFFARTGLFRGFVISGV